MNDYLQLQASAASAGLQTSTPPQVDVTWRTIALRKRGFDEDKILLARPHRSPVSRAIIALMSNVIVNTWEVPRLEPTARLTYVTKPASRMRRMSLAEARVLARQISEMAEMRRQEYLEEESERERLILAAAYDL